MGSRPMQSCHKINPTYLYGGDTCSTYIMPVHVHRRSARVCVHVCMCGGMTQIKVVGASESTHTHACPILSVLSTTHHDRWMQTFQSRGSHQPDQVVSGLVNQTKPIISV